MAALPFTISQKEALPQLLDDPSPVVQQALLELFLAHGDESVELLRTVASQPNQTLAAHAAHYLGRLNSADPVGDFRRFIRSLNYELETGALLLSRTVNADLDVGSCCTQLDALAARCRELITAASTPREQCRVLNHVLLQEFGLRGNTEHYTDPLNSFLDQVLIRRKGLPPITVHRIPAHRGADRPAPRARRLARSFYCRLLRRNPALLSRSFSCRCFFERAGSSLTGSPQ